MSENTLLEVSDLAKTFHVGFWRRKVEAVRGISFTVREGEVFGVVGPNGAGKTTTMKMLTGLIFPDRGTIRLFGESIDRVDLRRRVGYLPEAPYFYEHLTARELLFYYGSLHGLKRATIAERADKLLKQVGLEGAKNRSIRKFSKGMRQRVGIAQALINDPEFVILDEPQSGLDPVGRKEIRDLIFDLKRQGKTVFFSSHILPDVEAVCDRVAVVYQGKIQEIGYLEELTSQHTTSLEILAHHVDEAKVKDLPGLQTLEARGNLTLLQFAAQVDPGDAVAKITSAGGEIYSVTPHREGLEEVFLRGTADEGAEP